MTRPPFGSHSFRFGGNRVPELQLVCKNGREVEPEEEGREHRSAILFFLHQELNSGKKSRQVI
jgi:hypothetical protein